MCKFRFFSLYSLRTFLQYSLDEYCQGQIKYNIHLSIKYVKTGLDTYAGKQLQKAATDV
jgi:hypothetical protein